MSPDLKPFRTSNHSKLEITVSVGGATESMVEPVRSELESKARWWKYLLNRHDMQLIASAIVANYHLSRHPSTATGHHTDHQCALDFVVQLLLVFSILQAHLQSDESGDHSNRVYITSYNFLLKTNVGLVCMLKDLLLSKADCLSKAECPSKADCQFRRLLFSAVQAGTRLLYLHPDGKATFHIPFGTILSQIRQEEDTWNALPGNERMILVACQNLVTNPPERAGGLNLPSSQSRLWPLDPRTEELSKDLITKHTENWQHSYWALYDIIQAIYGAALEWVAEGRPDPQDVDFNASLSTILKCLSDRSKLVIPGPHNAEISASLNELSDMVRSVEEFLRKGSSPSIQVEHLDPLVYVLNLDLDNASSNNDESIQQILSEIGKIAGTDPVISNGSHYGGVYIMDSSTSSMNQRQQPKGIMRELVVTERLEGRGEADTPRSRTTYTRYRNPAVAEIKVIQDSKPLSSMLGYVDKKKKSIEEWQTRYGKELASSSRKEMESLQVRACTGNTTAPQAGAAPRSPIASNDMHSNPASLLRRSTQSAPSPALITTRLKWSSRLKKAFTLRRIFGRKNGESANAN